MHGVALVTYLLLGLVEFAVINSALRNWTGRRGLAIILIAVAASYVPLIGGGVACLAAIAVLEWPWWLAGGIFIGGTITLGLTGGMAAVLGRRNFVLVRPGDQCATVGHWGLVLIPVAQCIEQKGKRRRVLPAAWVIKMVSRERGTPIGQHTDEPPFLNVSPNVILRQIGQTELRPGPRSAAGRCC